MTNRHEYKTAYEIYVPFAQKVKTAKDFQSINVIGVFICYKENLKTIVLEDGTHDSYFYVRALNQSIIDVFRPYFRPGYIFRFLKVQCTACQNYSSYNPKTIRLNANIVGNVAVFEWLTNSETDRFSFVHSQNPQILPSDWQMVERIRDEWCSRINSVSIQDLDRILMNNKRSDFEKATFMAQIIEIKQLSPRKMIIKLWDGTTPEFEPKLPINQADVNLNEDSFVPAGLRDNELEEQSKGKAIYVMLLGDKINCFISRKPGEYILLIKTKLYYWNKTHPKIFRIEVNDHDRKDSEEYQFIVFLKPNSNLGKLLTDKLNPSILHHSDHHSNRSPEVQPSRNNNQIESPNSFDETIDRNLVIKINKFSKIRNNRNYEIFCKIVDVFPLNYKIYDLIYLECKHCNLNDSVHNLFETDLNGLRRAATIFLEQYGLNRNDMNCPNCSNAKAFFKFFIILLLEDPGEDQMIALFERTYADRYFELNPLEVLADEKNEQLFLRRFEELRDDYQNLNDPLPQRHMVINKSKEDYLIKNIVYKRNLIV